VAAAAAAVIAAAPKRSESDIAESRRLKRLYGAKPEDTSANDRSDILEGFIPVVKSGFNPIHRSSASESRSSYRGVMRPNARPAAGG